MKLLIIALTIPLLFACGKKEANKELERGVDQCKRAELFNSCLERIPKGPQVVGEDNDWSDVVDSCNQAAWGGSTRITKYIAPECRSE